VTKTKVEDVIVEEKVEEIAVEPPKDHKVIFLNDDYTPMEFVIQALMQIFDHDILVAESLTAQIHEEGSAVVAVLPYEIAEHKGVEVTYAARNSGFPLQVKIEPED
jgi:ATP-dependent Clp protease adaptor protein ClpS